MPMRMNKRDLYAVVTFVTWTAVSCAGPPGPAVRLRDALEQEANRIRLLAEVSSTVEFVPSSGAYWIALVPPGASSRQLTRPASLTPDDEDRLTSCEADATSSRVLVADRRGVECVSNEGVDVTAFQWASKDNNEPVRVRLARDGAGVHVVDLR
jgi:hypothetical protein